MFLYNTATSLLPLWTVQTAQSNRYCTLQLYIYPRKGYTAFGEPHCLYITSIPLFLRAVDPLESLKEITGCL